MDELQFLEFAPTADGSATSRTTVDFSKMVLIGTTILDDGTQLTDTYLLRRGSQWEINRVHRVVERFGEEPQVMSPSDVLEPTGIWRPLNDYGVSQAIEMAYNRVIAFFVAHPTLFPGMTEDDFRRGGGRGVWTPPNHP